MPHPDPFIDEVRALKRAASERFGHDLQRIASRLKFLFLEESRQKESWNGEYPHHATQKMEHVPAERRILAAIIDRMYRGDNRVRMWVLSKEQIRS